MPNSLKIKSLKNKRSGGFTENRYDGIRFFKVKNACFKVKKIRRFSLTESRKLLVFARGWPG